MATLNHRSDIKRATATLSALEAAVVAASDDGLRPHLGASQIGKDCERALWYSFRWSQAAAFDGRLLRLFARGQREEDSLAACLEAIPGVQVSQTDPRTGQQYRFQHGHFGGSMDGAVLGLPDAPGTWHVLEFKTHNAKSFNALDKDGVQRAKPEHYAQMQCYMAWTGMDRALYVAVCKDDDRLHLERIDFDRSAYDALAAKAQRVIAAVTPPAGISERPDWYQCKWCDYHSICFGPALPLPTCRSCLHVTPTAEGQWQCERHALTLTLAQQKDGCQAHRYLPPLMANRAEVVDADTEANWVRYRDWRNDEEFINGLSPEGLLSVTLYQQAEQEGGESPCN